MTEEITLEQFGDARGVLTPVEFNDLPFKPQRLFTIDSVPAGQVRGGHGHLNCWQFLIALAGAIEVTILSRNTPSKRLLSPGGCGLVIPPKTISEQRYIKPGSMLLVLASEPYDLADYFTAPAASSL